MRAMEDSRRDANTCLADAVDSADSARADSPIGHELQLLLQLKQIEAAAARLRERIVQSTRTARQQATPAALWFWAEPSPPLSGRRDRQRARAHARSDAELAWPR
jgi:hypothetical protein